MLHKNVQLLANKNSLTLFTCGRWPWNSPSPSSLARSNVPLSRRNTLTLFDNVKSTVSHEDEMRTASYSRYFLRNFTTLAAIVISGSHQILTDCLSTEDLQRWHISLSSKTLSAVLIYAFSQDSFPRSQTNGTLQLFVRLTL